MPPRTVLFPVLSLVAAVAVVAVALVLYFEVVTAALRLLE